MSTLNLGIVAHVDAGKTTLTERLLFAAGVIDEIGRVDDGNTQTYTLTLERQRGITIKSTVMSFVIDDVTVNLIDTPGHPDFIAEVERVLGVLDGAVLVISAVEGVQSQTRLLMRTLQRLRVPTLIFVNKIDRGSAVQRASVAAGRIGRLWGLGEVRIGDAIGEPPTTPERHYFAPPTLETVVVPRRPADKGALHVALTQLAEQDPLFNVHQDDVRQELHISLYGEVQKEVIGATLKNEYAIDVTFRETTAICVERPIGVGTAVELLPRARSPTTPFLATIGLRIEPAAHDSGVQFGLDVQVGSIPTHVFKTVEAFRDAMERNVLETLRQGIYGWEVTDCCVTMIDCDYQAPPRRWPGTTASDFRLLTPLALIGALRQAGTVVCEPIHRFHLEIPSDMFGATVSALARLRAVPQTQEMRGSSYILEGEVPVDRVHTLQQHLPALTRGEGLVECEFDSYRAVCGKVPTRPRTDYNPLNRKEYLLHVMRRV
jgi:ribosomal protection tetracycline resistance protein